MFAIIILLQLILIGLKKYCNVHVHETWHVIIGTRPCGRTGNEAIEVLLHVAFLSIRA